MRLKPSKVPIKLNLLISRNISDSKRGHAVVNNWLVQQSFNFAQTEMRNCYFKIRIVYFESIVTIEPLQLANGTLLSGNEVLNKNSMLIELIGTFSARRKRVESEVDCLIPQAAILCEYCIAAWGGTGVIKWQFLIRVEATWRLFSW